MDQSIINWILAAAGTAFGFIGKSLWESVKDLHAADRGILEKLGNMQVEVAGRYATRDELKSAIDRIGAQLDRIEEKIEKKADK